MKKRRAGTPLVALRNFPPGHFTALMRAPSRANAAGFPPRFVPQYVPTRVNAAGQTMGEVSAQTRLRLAAQGITGTIVGGLSDRTVVVSDIKRSLIAKR